MTSTDIIRGELEKALSLVAAARRLLATGARVELSALENRVRWVCEAVAQLDRETGRSLLPGLEALIANIDRLGGELTSQHDRLSSGPDQT